MGLEAGGFVSNLNTSNPTASDLRSQGDDHLRLIKAALQATFPNAAKAFYFPASELVDEDTTIEAGDQNRTFVVDPTDAAVTLTLPSLSVDDAGWECHFIKTGTSTNPYFVTPASGTIQSGDQAGLAKTRRSIPGVRCSAFWTGDSWFITRACTATIGSIIHAWRSDTPIGFEIANGATLSSASSNYPDFYQANGNSGVLPDVTGRAMFGKEATATRLTSAGGGIDGATKGATGGAQSTTLSQGNLPNVNLTGGSHTHSASLGGGTDAQGTHSHTYTRYGSFVNNLQGNGGNDSMNQSNTTQSTSSAGNHAHNVAVSGTTGASGSLTISLGGSGTSFTNLPPGIVVPAFVVVE